MAEKITVKEALEILKDNIRLVRVLPNGEHIFKCPFCENKLMKDEIINISFTKK